MSSTISSIASTSGSTNAYQVDTKSAATKQAAAETKQAAPANDVAAVYEKSPAPTDASKGIYSINKMSEADRSALVNQLKQEEANRMESFNKMVMDTVLGQSKSYSFAAGSDDMWKFLASGDYTVDAATKKQAEEDISEDGYWGVKQTSQRLFDFASALAGDDEGMMAKMQDAIKQGFKDAGAVWGKDLPDITNQTLDATNKMFDDYFASKKNVEGSI
ncbi:MAG: hypothetical protein K6G83_05550 [Lachnospiraceae bacterium]|nr:hypothetical protein [Lachnospiraceae bacterium]